MGNLTGALVVVVAMNMLMFIAQMAMIDIDPSATQMYDCQGSLLSAFDSNRCAGQNYSLANYAEGSNMPNSNPSISSSTGNIFTDTFSAMKNWLFDTFGINYLLQVLKAPYIFLQFMHLPDPISWVIAAFWYAITFFLFVNWIRGTDS